MAAVSTVTEANVYLDGNNFLGQVKELDIPALTYIQSDHQSLGMLGVASFFTGVEKMEGRIMWPSWTPQIASAFSNPLKPVMLTVRAVLKEFDGVTYTNRTIVTDMVVMPSDKPGGNHKPQEGAEYESNYIAHSIVQKIDGIETLNFNVVSNTFKVDGVDILADYRANLGI